MCIDTSPKTGRIKTQWMKKSTSHLINFQQIWSKCDHFLCKANKAENGLKNTPHFITKNEVTKFMNLTTTETLILTKSSCYRNIIAVKPDFTSRSCFNFFSSSLSLSIVNAASTYMSGKNVNFQFGKKIIPVLRQENKGAKGISCRHHWLWCFHSVPARAVLGTDSNLFATLWRPPFSFSVSNSQERGSKAKVPDKGKWQARETRNQTAGPPLNCRPPQLEIR